MKDTRIEPAYIIEKRNKREKRKNKNNNNSMPDEIRRAKSAAVADQFLGERASANIGFDCD
jgi:hypothetical protein